MSIEIFTESHSDILFEGEEQYTNDAPGSSILNDKLIGKFENFRKFYLSHVNIINMGKFNIDDDFTSSIFQDGVYVEIDELLVKIKSEWKKIRGIAKELGDCIGDEPLKIEKTNTQGYYFVASTKKAKSLKEQIKDPAHKKFSHLEFKDQTSNVKIFSQETKQFSENIQEHQQTLNFLNIEKFHNFLDEITEKYISCLYKISNFIADIDVSKSVAKISDINKYCRPKINLEKYSYLQAKGLRHPIIERIQTLTPYISNNICIGKELKGMLLYGLNFVGKCLDSLQPVLMFDGSIKLAKDIVNKDLLMGEDSKAKTVLSICSGEDEMYEIVPSKGRSYKVNSGHILTLVNDCPRIRYRRERGCYSVTWHEKGMKKTKSIRDKDQAEVFLKEREQMDPIFDICLKDFLQIYKKSSFLAYGFHVGVDYPDRDLPMDPYLFGYWLGDGTSSSSNITTAEVEIVDSYRELLKPYDLTITKGSDKYGYHIVNSENSKNLSIKNTSGYNGLIYRGTGDKKYWTVTYIVDGLVTSKEFNIKKYNNNVEEAKSKAVEFLETVITKNPLLKRNPFMDFLRDYNLLNNKHIPEVYKVNSRDKRLKLLAGLIDSDGYCDTTKNLLEITQKNIRLASDIEYLAYSLGFMVTHKEVMKTCTNSKNPQPKPYQRLYISGNISEIPCVLPRKNKMNTNVKPKHVTRCRLTIKPLGKGTYNGFTLDGNGRFLLGDFTVTHNTSLIRSIGMAVIQAQAGLFVAAEEFEFSPFKSVLTKIAIQDNLFKNQSTFISEMIELKNMLELGDNKTLILADELCSGTENVSAVSLVASTILTLIKNQSNFVFTTHYHNLMDVSQISNLESVKAYYLEVKIINGELVFNRTLREGRCMDQYGIEVAESMKMPLDFITNALNIRKQLNSPEQDELIDGKVSRYNSNLYMTKCQICQGKEKLHSHHLIYQKEFTKDNKIPFDKNIQHNLVVLCEKCHILTHQDKIIINGYLQTSSGIKLDYKTL